MLPAAVRLFRGRPVTRRLRRLYWTLLGPALVLFAVLYAVKKFELVDTRPLLLGNPWLGPVLLLVAGGCGVAGPILLRTLFVRGLRNARRVEEGRLERFERRILAVALAAPYAALAAAFLEVPTVFFGGAVLSAFYAVYYFYPSERRLAHERRIFRVGTR